MKTVKTVLAGIMMLLVCVAANATVKPATDKPTKNDVVNVYIDAIAHGKISNLDKFLDDNLQFNMKRGENVNTLNKNELMDYLKTNAMDDPSVKVTTTVQQEDDNSAVVKVDFAYTDYVRTDVVTLSNTNGWVVASVTSTFK
jgi:hypothetical protein